MFGLADFKLENLITMLMPMLNLTMCNSFYNKIRVLDVQKEKKKGRRMQPKLTEVLNPLSIEKCNKKSCNRSYYPGKLMFHCAYVCIFNHFVQTKPLRNFIHLTSHVVDRCWTF